MKIASISKSMVNTRVVINIGLYACLWVWSATFKVVTTKPLCGRLFYLNFQFLTTSCSVRFPLYSFTVG